MTDPSSSDSPKQKFERRLHPRIQCEERVTFDTETKEKCGGVINNLSLSGCLLITIERLNVNTDLILYLTLTIGDSSTICEIAGKIVNLNPKIKSPLRGYGIFFSATNSPIVKKAIKDLVDAKLMESMAPPKPVQVASALPSSPTPL